MASSNEALLKILEQRFIKHQARHPQLSWPGVEKRLLAQPKKLLILQAMEDSGGEPDVVAQDPNTHEFVFCDCCAESPAARRSLCYDRAALDARKENKPRGNAIELAREIGAEILNEQEYRYLQTLGEFDKKTSSWIMTPDSVRKLGGALFCDRRYDQVFVYHNGAESYYAARGFRTKLVV
ncbi:MAG: DUF4256 domain-containing protein [Burkholderiaceae bacterium]|nr:MAG: DUF4256 domain-containing protein [Burkholderiaceae bacterium]